MQKYLMYTIRGDRLIYADRINLSNPQGVSRFVKKYEAEDDTAMFYQIRELFKERNAGFDDEDESCLSESVVIVDFGNLFMMLNSNKENNKDFYRRLKSRARIKETNPQRNDNKTNEIDDESKFIIEYDENTIDNDVEYALNHINDYDNNEDDSTVDRVISIFENGIEITFKSGKTSRFIPADKSQSMARNSRILFIDEAMKMSQVSVIKADYSISVSEKADVEEADVPEIWCDFYKDSDDNLVVKGIDDDTDVIGIIQTDRSSLVSKYMSGQNIISAFDVCFATFDNNLQDVPEEITLRVYSQYDLDMVPGVEKRLGNNKVKILKYEKYIGDDDKPYIKKINGRKYWYYIRKGLKDTISEGMDTQNTLESRLNLDMDFSRLGKAQLSKIYAYRGLFLSSAYRIDAEKSKVIVDEEKVIVIDDSNETIQKDIFPKGKISELIFTNKKDYQKNSLEYDDPRESEIEINAPFDGEGLISPEYASKINEYLTNNGVYRNGAVAESFQIRMPYVKGMLHTVDFKGFIKEFTDNDEKECIIKDCFGKERNVFKAEIILTKSMFKAAGWIKELVNPSEDKNIDEMEYYFTKFRKYKHSLYISGSDIPYSGRKLGTTSYQYLNTLAMRKEGLDKLVKDHMSYMERLDEYYELTNTGKGSVFENNDENDERNETVSDDLPNWIYAYIKNPVAAKNSFVNGKIKGTRNHIIKNLAYGKIFVKGEVRYLSRDLMLFLKYLLELLEIEEEKVKKLERELLDRNSFYIPCDNIDLEEGQWYPLYRSPHLSRNEQCALKAKIDLTDMPLRQKYLGKLKGVLMVSKDSFIPEVLGGADFDGDIVKIFNNEIIRDAVLVGAYNMEGDYDCSREYERKLPVAQITGFESDGIKSSDSSRIDFQTIYDTFATKVGRISNLAVRRGQIIYKPQFYNDLEVEGLNNDKKQNSCAACTILTGLEIDACKTGYHPFIEGIEKKEIDLSDAVGIIFLVIRKDIIDDILSGQSGSKGIWCENNNKIYEQFNNLMKSKMGKNRFVDLLKIMIDVLYCEQKNLPATKAYDKYARKGKGNYVFKFRNDDKVENVFEKTDDKREIEINPVFKERYNIQLVMNGKAKGKKEDHLSFYNVNSVLLGDMNLLKASGNKEKHYDYITNFLNPVKAWYKEGNEVLDITKAGAKLPPEKCKEDTPLVNLPVCLYDYINGKDKTGSKIGKTNTKTDNYLFAFEGDPLWEDSLNPDKVKKAITFVRVYKIMKRVVVNANYRKKSLIETIEQHEMELYRISKLNGFDEEQIKVFFRNIGDIEAVKERLFESDWPYLSDGMEKERLSELIRIIGYDKAEYPEHPMPENMSDAVCKFDNDGYRTLYLLIEIECLRRSIEAKTLFESAEKRMMDNNAPEQDDQLYKDLKIQLIDKMQKCEKEGQFFDHERFILNYMRDAINDIFKEESECDAEKFMTVYKADKKGDLFWRIYKTDDIKKYIFIPGKESAENVK